MKHETSGNTKYSITETEVTFTNVLNKEYVPVHLKEDLKKASALIIPNEGFKDVKKPLFPEGTLDFYKFLKELEYDDTIIDICADDDDFSELELHDDVINIPLLLVNGLAFPAIVGFIILYFENVLFKKKPNPKVTLDIVVQRGDTSKKVHFEGSAKDFKDIIDEIQKGGQL